MSKKQAYRVEIQYLGFRMHGWSKQPGLKTVHYFVDKTIAFVLQHDRFKTLGSSRTDAKVSANAGSFTLWLEDAIDESFFLQELNKNFPTDIRALKVQSVAPNTNALQPNKMKEYLYLFAFGQKAHPFCASLVTVLSEPLNLELMKAGAKLFEGHHNFCNYVTKPSANTQTERAIAYCQIEENTFYTASFFPEKSYALRIQSQGFMRNQVRLIMGQLFDLGLGKIDLNFIKSSLCEKAQDPLPSIAPGSGLILQTIYDQAESD